MRQPPSVRLAEGVARWLRRVLPKPLLRLAYRVGYLVLNVWWKLTCPVSAGSKVVVTRGDELLLIRLTYGARQKWDLPGGTTEEGESPSDTAARELREEVGLAGPLRPLGSWTSSGRGRRGVLHGFQMEVPAGAEPVIDDVEIAVARWFVRDAIPSPLARGTDVIVRSWTDTSPTGRHGTSE